MNVSVAKECDNSTEEIPSTEDMNLKNMTIDKSSDDVLKLSDDAFLSSSNKIIKSRIAVESNVTFDVVGDYFKVKLSDENNNAISNAGIIFSISGSTYKKTTNSEGIATLKLKLNDGDYDIKSKFMGNPKYSSCSKTTKIHINNTKVVSEGLSNFEIQKIIDNAKNNNIILFSGNVYEEVNLIINKSLTLISKSNTVLKSSSENPVVSIVGRNSSLTKIIGFTIQSNGNGIEVKDSDYVTICNNTISSNQNGILVENASHLEIYGNSIIRNLKNGIVYFLSDHVYIYDNLIHNNGENGILVSKSNDTYIYNNSIKNNDKNGIYASNYVDDDNYIEGPRNLHIYTNTIEKNHQHGIYLKKTEGNLEIINNEIANNLNNGLTLSDIGSNIIQSNVIKSNYDTGIKFEKGYTNPKSQDISYNAVFDNLFKEMEGSDYYDSTGEQLKIGDNWYSDYGFVCPKINTNNMRFSVTQIGNGLFLATVYDSNGNLATKLPERMMKYQINSEKNIWITLTGGSAVFKVDANDEDLIKSSLDRSKRITTYDSNAITFDYSQLDTESGININYPNIQRFNLFEDMLTGNYGEGNGEGEGEGSYGDSNQGHGNSSYENSEVAGNSTYSQKLDPGSSSTQSVNKVLESDTVQALFSQESASLVGSENSLNGVEDSKSVIKQISIDEDNIINMKGIPFLLLLILLAIITYYRDDIKELKSKL